MKVERLILGSLGTNCYIIYDDNSYEAAIVDPAENADLIIEKVEELKLNIKYIIITHAHCDHIAALDEVKREFSDAKICIGKYDANALNNSTESLCSLFGTQAPASKADILIADGYTLLLGNDTLNFIHTPGHTKGAISIHINDMLISGDTLFLESIGRSDFPGGSMSELMSSIKNKLYLLKEDTLVYPGHGEFTTIGHEKNNNPYVW